MRSHRCILSKFYIKPQLLFCFHVSTLRCILSKFYIKPQLGRQCPNFCCVVSYRNSTSNHNSMVPWVYVRSVVSYRNSTSNHNNARRQWRFQQLYLIEILHQTTTPCAKWGCTRRCILSKFYIKPQLPVTTLVVALSCILSKFYIKPQLYDGRYDKDFCCILSKFYIKPQRRASY